MFWRCVRVYASGIVVIGLSLLLPFTGNSPAVLAIRGVLIGGALVVSTRENVRMRRERRGRREKRRANGGRRAAD